MAIQFIQGTTIPNVGSFGVGDAADLDPSIEAQLIASGRAVGTDRNDTKAVVTSTPLLIDDEED